MGIERFNYANKLRAKALNVFAVAGDQLERANKEFERLSEESEDRVLSLKAQIDDELNAQRFAIDRMDANTKTINKIKEILA